MTQIAVGCTLTNALLLGQRWAACLYDFTSCHGDCCLLLQIICTDSLLMARPDTMFDALFHLEVSQT
jgi:hypothetical protein